MTGVPGRVICQFWVLEVFTACRPGRESGYSYDLGPYHRIRDQKFAGIVLHDTASRLFGADGLQITGAKQPMPVIVGSQFSSSEISLAVLTFERDSSSPWALVPLPASHQSSASAARPETTSSRLRYGG